MLTRLFFKTKICPRSIYFLPMRWAFWAIFGELEWEKSPKIGIEKSPEFPSNPGIQILGKKSGDYFSIFGHLQQRYFGPVAYTFCRGEFKLLQNTKLTLKKLICQILLQFCQSGQISLYLVTSVTRSGDLLDFGQLFWSLWQQFIGPNLPHS